MILISQLSTQGSEREIIHPRAHTQLVRRSWDPRRPDPNLRYAPPELIIQVGLSVPGGSSELSWELEM